MRSLCFLPPCLLVSLATTAAAIEIPYLSTLNLPISIQDYFPPTFTTNTTAQEQRTAGDLRRRGGSECPNDFHACSNLGAPGLCCANAAICTPDEDGNVACCPSSVVCTGVVTGSITTGTVNSEGSVIGTATGTVTSSGNGGATTTTNGVTIGSNSATTSPAASSSAGEVIGGGGGGGGSGSTSDAVRKVEIPFFARLLVRAFASLAF